MLLLCLKSAMNGELYRDSPASGLLAPDAYPCRVFSSRIGTDQSKAYGPCRAPKSHARLGGYLNHLAAHAAPGLLI